MEQFTPRLFPTSGQGIGEFSSIRAILPFFYWSGVIVAKKRRSPFEILKQNKVPLTDEERRLVMARKAIWHHGPGGAPSPAVWKSKDSRGKTTFVTNTHRAYNTAPTVQGAISRYHKFIKGTA